MPRPGTKITSFPPEPKTVSIPALPGSSPLPMILQPQNMGTVLPPPLPLPQQPQNIGLPPELVAEEPITFPPEMTIDELIEIRRNVGAKSQMYWAAFDEIQRKRDWLYEVHLNSQLKAMQDLTIALYTVNKKKVPKTVGQPFESD